MQQLSIVKDSFHYTLFAFLSKGASFFITPYITYQISPEEFGKFSETQLFWSIGVIIGGFGLEEIISKNYIDKRKEYQKWYSAIIFFQAIMVIAFGIVFLFYSSTFRGSNFLSAGEILKFFTWILGTVWYYDYLRYLRISENKRRYITISSGYIITQIILILCGFKLSSSNGYTILLFCYSLTAIIFGLISLYKMKITSLNFKLGNILLISPVIRFSKNILINNLSEWMLRSLPLVIIASYPDGMLMLGLFTSLSIFIIGFVELSKAIINAILPKILSAQRDNKKAEFFEISKYYKALGLSLSILLLFFGDGIFRFVINPEYTIQVSNKLVQIIIIIGFLIFLGLYQNQIISYKQDLSMKTSRVQPFIATVICGILFYTPELNLENILYTLLAGYSILYILKETIILQSHKKISSAQVIISSLPLLTLVYIFWS